MQIKQALPKLERRIQDLDDVQIDDWSPHVKDSLDSLHKKIEGTLMDVLGHDTLDYKRYKVTPFWQSVPIVMGRPTPDHGYFTLPSRTF